MKTFDFTLKSGAKLKVTMSDFEKAMALVETIKRVTVGWASNLDLGDAVFSNADVRHCIFECGDKVLYDNIRLTTALFDDIKMGERARGDYFEMCGHVIAVNTNPFFLKTSSTSTTPKQDPSVDQELK